MSVVLVSFRYCYVQACSLFVDELEEDDGVFFFTEASIHALCEIDANAIKNVNEAVVLVL